jgi:hypothetical protein
MLPEPPRCVFPGCPEWADHPHHVTYEPEVIKLLCFGHHEQITFLNGQQARKYRTVLSNKFRWWIWYQWIAGKLKPRRTQKAREWTEDWRGRSADPFEQNKTESEAVNVVPKRKPSLRKTRRTESKKAKPRKTKGESPSRKHRGKESRKRDRCRSK